MDPWFDPQTAGVVGGVLGAVIGGGFGGIGGGVGGPLAAQGKARGFVVGIFVTGVVVGIVLALIGVVALAMGQPYYVWSAFMLPGVVSAVVMGGILPVIKSAYAQHEQRKLDADAIREA